jgi:predicted ABC-type ATPase
VNSGGHDIPEPVIHRRYHAGIVNLSKLYLPICDYWLVIDNSEPPLQVIAEGFKTKIIEINDQTKYDKIIRL